MTDIRLFNKFDKLILPIILIILWYIICDVLILVPSYMFPGPVEVVNAFIKLLVSGKLFRDVIDTLYKVLFAKN